MAQQPIQKTSFRFAVLRQKDYQVYTACDAITKVVSNIADNMTKLGMAERAAISKSDDESAVNASSVSASERVKTSDDKKSSASSLEANKSPDQPNLSDLSIGDFSHEGPDNSIPTLFFQQLGRIFSPQSVVLSSAPMVGPLPVSIAPNQNLSVPLSNTPHSENGIKERTPSPTPSPIPAPALVYDVKSEDRKQPVNDEKHNVYEPAAEPVAASSSESTGGSLSGSIAPFQILDEFSNNTPSSANVINEQNQSAPAPVAVTEPEDRKECAVEEKEYVHVPPVDQAVNSPPPPIDGSSPVSKAEFCDLAKMVKTLSEQMGFLLRTQASLLEMKKSINASH